MAQGFQDLTGQIIRRVIALVEELEGNLVELVRISGQNLLTEQRAETKSHAEASGPPVPGLDKGTVSGQDEVDDLLSSLGF
jgi:chemotaxis protein CheZ